MSKVTVSQLADVLGVECEKLLSQLNDTGIEAESGEDVVSNDDKKKLLAHLRASHGKVESDATAPRQVTLKRKSVSELRVAGSGPRASTRTVNVDVRKRRTYVKREVVQEQIGSDDSDREHARRILEEAACGGRRNADRWPSSYPCARPASQARGGCQLGQSVGNYLKTKGYCRIAVAVPGLITLGQ